MKLNIVGFFMLIIIPGYGQTIEIGQDASKVKTLVELSVQRTKGYDSYGNSKGNNVVSDVKYFNGAILEIKKCYVNEFIVDLQMNVDYCEHFIMEYGRLAYVLAHYKNVSVSELQEVFDHIYLDTKVGSVYYSDDYTSYHKIFIADNGLATTKWGATNLNNLPQSIKTALARQRKEKEEAEKLIKLEEKERMEKEKEITSKTYDLQEHFPEKYLAFVDDQRQAIKQYFSSSSDHKNSERFPSFDSLQNSEIKSVRFENKYTVHYKLQNDSNKSADYDYIFSEGLSGKVALKKVELLSGIDEKLKLFNVASIIIPTAEIEGYEVLTKATISNVEVSFTRGVTLAKIKNGEVKFKKHPPELDIFQQITDKLKNEPNGNYNVVYECSAIMGQTDVTTKITKINAEENSKTPLHIVLVSSLIFLGLVPFL